MTSYTQILIHLPIIFKDRTIAYHKCVWEGYDRNSNTQTVLLTLDTREVFNVYNIGGMSGMRGCFRECGRVSVCVISRSCSLDLSPGVRKTGISS